MSSELQTREQLFAVMEQIAEEREAARPIVEELLTREPADLLDIEIPEEWRTAGFVQELTKQAATIWQSDPIRSLPLQQLALAVAASVSTYPTFVQARLEGISWKEIGYVHFMQNAYVAALRAYDSAESCFSRDSLLSQDSASIKLARAILFTFISQHERAAPLIEESAQVLLQFGDDRRLAMAELTRALVQQHRGELEAARDRFERLLSAIRPTDDVHTIATVYHNLGIVHRDLGNPNEAVAALQSARDIYEEIGIPTDKSDWALATVLLGTGEFEKALVILGRVRDVFLSRRMPQDAGEVALDMVEALLAADRFTEARALTEQVLREFVSAGLNESAITALSYLRNLLPRTQQARRAIRHVRSYLERLRLEPSRIFIPLADTEL